MSCAYGPPRTCQASISRALTHQTPSPSRSCFMLLVPNQPECLCCPPIATTAYNCRAVESCRKGHQLTPCHGTFSHARACYHPPPPSPVAAAAGCATARSPSLLALLLLLLLVLAPRRGRGSGALARRRRPGPLVGVKAALHVGDERLLLRHLVAQDTDRVLWWRRNGVLAGRQRRASSAAESVGRRSTGARGRE